MVADWLQRSVRVDAVQTIAAIHSLEASRYSRPARGPAAMPGPLLAPPGDDALPQLP
jgi:hypothetical protein